MTKLEIVFSTVIVVLVAAAMIPRGIWGHDQTREKPCGPALITQYQISPTTGFCTTDGKKWWKAREDLTCYAADEPK